MDRSTPLRAAFAADVSALASARLAGAESGAAAGLVSVPTSHAGLSASLSGAVALGEGAEVRRAVGAFAVDKDARRLSSLRCQVGVAARCLAVQPGGLRAYRAWMVTLTYRGTNDDWGPDHMKTAMNRLRDWCNRQGFAARYVWVAELQKRGVIHYHALVYLPAGVRCPAFDARGWWPHGMTNRKLVRKSAVAYLMKYLSKGTDVSAGTFPKGARIYGCGGLNKSSRVTRRWLRLPSFVQANSSVWDDWRRAVGGGWLSPSGEWFPSEFSCAIAGGVRSLVRRFTHPRTLEPSGPFSWLSDRELAALS